MKLYSKLTASAISFAFVLLLAPVNKAEAVWWPFMPSEEERGYHAEFPANIPYQDECGACHIAYPPQLLPKAGWEKLISGLDNHFGEDARPDKTERSALLQYLQHYASDSDNSGDFEPFSQRLQDPAPLRVTELRYWRLKHDKVLNNLARYVTNNPDVGSVSRCNACHSEAEKGVFQTHTVDIPNISKREYR